MIPNRNELRGCSACGEPVLWTITAAGRYLLVNAKPDEKGNQACYRKSPRTWQSRSLDAAGALPLAKWEHRYVPHVATCKPKPHQEALPLALPDNVVRIDRKRRRPRSR